MRARQTEDEARAPAGFGFHPHIAAVLEDRLARQRQSQPQPVAVLLLLTPEGR